MRFLTAGAASSVGASTLFGVTFYLAGVVDATPTEVLGWRIVITALFLAALAVTGAGRAALSALSTLIRAKKVLVGVLVLTALLVGVQMWMFAWTPAHGHAFDASFGYLLLPLCLVVVGRLVFRDPLSTLQWVAVAIAGIAVVANATVSGPASWVTFVICGGYTLYFSLRRRFRLDMPAAFGIECAMLMPVAVALIALSPSPFSAPTPLLLLMAIVAALAMWLYLNAALRLSMPAFGLLGYLESVLLFVAAIALGESLSVFDWILFIMLVAALFLMALDGMITLTVARRLRPPAVVP
ncbi:MAG: EamA family transporter RarD [Microcella sp.]|uniref:EamA family transporter RarD n=1 Tax=Microcella sp. TaxID=1913979 RepID=UPI0024C8F538|nr:EamA family transporter RarD [Microcella sp.]UYN83229.1 MAG: EamA family transporter RarD [Microcella sp.]